MGRVLFFCLNISRQYIYILFFSTIMAGAGDQYKYFKDVSQP